MWSTEQKSSTQNHQSKKLKIEIERVIVVIHFLFFAAWASTVVKSIAYRTDPKIFDWSNVLIPAFLFSILIISSYFAGRVLSNKIKTSYKTKIGAILISSIQVSSAVASALFIILIIGYVMYKLPIGLIIFAPSALFLVLFAFSFVLHSVIAWFAIAPENQ